MTAPAASESAWSTLPRRQLLWTGATLLGALGAWWAGVRAPDDLLRVGLVVTALVVTTGVLRALAVLLAVATWLLPWLDLAPLACGVGALGALSVPHPHDALDGLLGALAAVAGTGLAIAALGAAPWSDLAHTGAAVALFGAVTSAALWPSAWRHDHPEPPSEAQLRRLPERVRTQARSARDLVRQTLPRCEDVAVRRGLVEVARWVVRLQARRAELDAEVVRLHPSELRARLGTEAPTPVVLRHLERLAARRASLADEAGRCAALCVDALAWLEDTRATIAITGGHDDPAPELATLLDHLRSHGRVLVARQATRRELAG